ncbi:unnamed protein product [Lactuca virosa]|uniref:LisH domain-containing protein n=1 Tax=Lactuca virosa TaxID=75947 RepID=A0AAU9N8I8_9ASTR|nr:unnamed protein product [Lactuca virosa]
MQFGNLVNRDPKSVPKITDVQHDIVKRLIANYLVWSDPGESALGLANLGSIYRSPVTTVIPVLRADNLFLVECLYRKHRSKIVKRGSLSATKSKPPSHVDAGGESEAIRDTTITKNTIKFTGAALLSSVTHHEKPYRFLRTRRRKELLVLLLPNPSSGQGVVHPVHDLPPPDLSSSRKALPECSVTYDPAVISMVDASLSSPEVPLASSEATSVFTRLHSDSFVTPAKPLPSGSASKAYFRRSELAQCLFRHKVLSSFSPPGSILTSAPMISTSALTITPSFTEPIPDSAILINLDSLIPDMGTTEFDSTGPTPDFIDPTPDSSLTGLLPPPRTTEQRYEEIHWVLREGISSSNRYLLNSEEFSTMNVSLQSTAIELGLNRACLEMKNKYLAELEGKEVLYSYPNVEEVILQCFSDLTSYDYLFFKMLDTDNMDMGLLKGKRFDRHRLATDAE